MALWTPDDLVDLRCWLDASDSSTLFDAFSGGSLPGNNGAVAKWADKIGSNDATDVVDGTNTRITTQRPTRVTSAQNSLDAINFSGTQWFDHNSAKAMLRNRSSAIMAVAMKFGTVSNSAFQFAWTNRNAATGTLAIRFQLIHGDANNFSSNGRRLDADGSGASVSTSTNPPYNTDWHVHVALCDWTTGNFAYRIDGTQIGTSTYASSGNTSDTDLGTVANSTDGGTWTAIGAAQRTLRPVFGNVPLSSGSRIGEMLCHAKSSGSYVTADLQKVEGYLAWKWGLQGNLPNDHPYKNAAPTTDTGRRRNNALIGLL